MPLTATPTPTTKSHVAVTTSQKAGITFNDLSNDILIVIIRQIEIDLQNQVALRLSGDRPLINLSKCSRRLCNLVEPVLYSHYSEEHAYNTHPLQLFLKQLLKRPELSPLVKIYDCMAADSTYHDAHLDVSLFGADDWEKITTRVREVSENVDEATEWMDSIKMGNWEGITALTLTLVPNLQELNLGGWAHTSDNYPNLNRLISRIQNLQKERAFDDPLSMRHLKKVSVKYWDTEGGMSINMLIPFLSIPSIQTFWANMVEDEAPDASEEELEWLVPGLSFPHIKDLSLHYASMDHVTLARFLRCFPKLEKFYYIHGIAGYADFETPRMMAALEQLRFTLCDLTFFNDNQIGSTALEQYPLGSFVGFDKLKTLHLDSSMLTGPASNVNTPEHLDGFRTNLDFADSLPPNIKDLTLRGCEYNQLISSQISILVDHKSTRYHELKRIDLNWEKIKYPDKPSPPGPFKHPMFSKEDADRIWAKCEDLGIEMVMKVAPPQPKWVKFQKHEPLDEKSRALQSSGFGFTPNYCQIRVDYPYDDYEALCKEHGCDPKTGKVPGRWF